MQTYIDLIEKQADNHQRLKQRSMRVNMSGHASRRTTRKSHAPENSMLFEKIIPALLILMGILMVVLILFAAGVLLGIVHF